jgi:hypothetical protein
LENKAEDEGWEREVLRGRSWDAYDGPDAVRVFPRGALAEVVAYNREFTLDRWATSWVGYLWITFPLQLMMVGLLVGRSGVLRHLEDRKRLVHLTGWGGLAVGLGLYWLATPVFAWAAAGGWNPWIGFIGDLLFVMSALVLALAYGAGVFLLFQRDTVPQAAGPVGRGGANGADQLPVADGVHRRAFLGFWSGLVRQVRRRHRGDHRRHCLRLPGVLQHHLVAILPLRADRLVVALQHLLANAAVEDVGCKICGGSLSKHVIGIRLIGAWRGGSQLVAKGRVDSLRLRAPKASVAAARPG